jgi:hypothetical protein
MKVFIYALPSIVHEMKSRSHRLMLRFSVVYLRFGWKCRFHFNVSKTFVYSQKSTWHSKTKCQCRYSHCCQNVKPTVKYELKTKILHADVTIFSNQSQSDLRCHLGWPPNSDCVYKNHLILKADEESAKCERIFKYCGTGLNATLELLALRARPTAEQNAAVRCLRSGNALFASLFKARGPTHFVHVAPHVC